MESESSVKVKPKDIYRRIYITLGPYIFNLKDIGESTGGGGYREAVHLH